MSSELHSYVKLNQLARVKQVVEGGANIDELKNNGRSSLFTASLKGYFEIVEYLVERGANVSQPDRHGKTALHWACARGKLPMAKYLMDHGARVTEKSDDGKTALLHAAKKRKRLEVIQYLLSTEGGASITETDGAGNTVLLLAASHGCSEPVVQWLLELGGAQITDTNNEGTSVWTTRPSKKRKYGLLSVPGLPGLPNLLRDVHDYHFRRPADAYQNHMTIAASISMLRVMVLRSGPPASLVIKLPPPLQRIVRDGARLRAYLVRRRALLDAHCPLLPPLLDLVRGYEEPTTEELWATGLGAPLQRAKRPRFERAHSRKLRSARRLLKGL
jgi:hypothetical protein